MGCGHQVRLPLNQLWRKDPWTGKGRNGASWGPRQQLSPPRAPATRAPEASTQGPASPEKGLEEQPNPQAINILAGVGPGHGMSVRTGASGGGLAGASLSVPLRATPESPCTPFGTVTLHPTSLSKGGPGPSPDQGPPKLPSSSARAPEATGQRSVSGLTQLHPTLHKWASPLE